MRSLLRKKSKAGNLATKPIVIVDCSALVYAAKHTMGTLSYNGRPTGIIFGFLNRILKYAEKFKTNDFVFCWDSAVSIREKYYPDYKKKRKKDKVEAEADEKITQLEMINQSHQLRDEILPYLGFKNNCHQVGFEADDLLAYWVNKIKGRKIILVTSDNDLYQCLSDRCCMYLPRRKKWLTCKAFTRKFKISPEQWKMAKAIGGCNGDQVQGIKGAGDPKNNPNSISIKYVKGELTKGIVYDRIKKSDDIIERNLKLVSLPCPLKKLKPMLRRRNRFNRKAFIDVFDKNRFISMLEDKNFKRWEKAFGIWSNTHG